MYTEARGRTPESITTDSFAIIRRELLERGYQFDDRMQVIIERIIHSTADFDYAERVACKPGAIEHGVAALRAGCVILTDVQMVKVGISAKRAAELGCTLHCFIDEDEVRIRAAAESTTRSVQSMRIPAERGILAGSIVAIGNAPTALEEVVRQIDMGIIPALVIGVPVGFVGTVESKAALMERRVPSIVTRGQKGGSTIAVATVNALLRLAVDASNDEV